MTSSRTNWPRVKEIFADAVGLAPEARHPFIVSACGGDAALQRQVLELLEAHDHGDRFLTQSVLRSENERESPARFEGAAIGPYKLAGRLGAGGMGEIYQAHDQRLNRTVAIKVLPPHLTRDRLAVERFELEARAVAALNHPHICTLYDVGHQDGMTFLVMEYLDGETLASRLERGPLKVEHALRCAVQIASALDAVHRAGFVHRDLKPGNIMLTKAGAKLLDFGISKARSSVESSRTPEMATTGGLTLAGTLLGTIRYMAPEQIAGGVVDARTDLFAFGAVVYELVVGARAFDGASNTSVMAAIRDGEPAASPRLSPALDRVVRTCLAKDPDDRWQTARDLLRQLQWLQSEPEGGFAARATGPRFPWRVAAAGVAITAVGVAAYLATRSTAPEGLSTRFEISTPPTSEPMSFALSADGRQLAFVANKDGVSKLWIRPLDQVGAQSLDGTDGASFPFWAPDGRALGFFAGGKLKRIDLNGGSPRVLADAPTGRGASWTRDGVIVFAPATAGALLRVSADGGTPVPATHLLAGENSHRWPQILPDGHSFLFLSTQGQPGSEGVFMGLLDSDRVTRVLPDDSAALYVPPGRVVLVRQGALVSLAFDSSRGVVSGEPREVARPVGFDAQLIRGAFAVSDTGVLAHRTAIAARRQLVWVDRLGRNPGPVGPPDEDGMAAPELSRDGHRITIFRSVDANNDIWTIPASSGVASRFTFEPTVESFPVWNSAAERVAYLTLRSGAYNVAERSMQGEEQTLFQQPGLKVPLDYCPNSRCLLYAVQVPATGVDLWALPLPVTSDQPAHPVAQTPFDEMAGQISPDGHWIAYQSNASGRMEIWTQAFPVASTQPQQLSFGGGSQPRWSADGQELFFVAPDGQMMSLAIRRDATDQTLESAPPQLLFKVSLASGANIPPAVGTRAQYAVAPDGRFLLNTTVQDAPAPPITIFVGAQTAPQ